MQLENLEPRRCETAVAILAQGSQSRHNYCLQLLFVIISNIETFLKFLDIYLLVCKSLRSKYIDIVYLMYWKFTLKQNIAFDS